MCFDYFVDSLMTLHILYLYFLWIHFHIRNKFIICSIIIDNFSSYFLHSWIPPFCTFIPIEIFLTSTKLSVSVLIISQRSTSQWSSQNDTYDEKSMFFFLLWVLLSLALKPTYGTPICLFSKRMLFLSL